MKPLKNYLLLFFVKVLQVFLKENPIEHTSPKILIITTTGLGDTLWATPAIKRVKEHFPSCYLAVFTTNLGKQILQQNPNIDEFFTFPKLFSLKMWKLWMKLRKKKFQIIFHFHSSQRPVLPFVCTIGAKKIIGYLGKTKGLDHLLTDKIKEKNIHEIEKRLELLKVLRIPAKISPPQFFPLSKQITCLKSYLPKKEKWILIHPGAKDRYKCWPFESYVLLAEQYLSRFVCKVFFSFGPKENEPKGALKNFPILKGLTFQDFAKCLESMDLVVTNDTGPMHLAAALHLPTIGLFASTDPKICGPIGKNTQIISVNKTCRPCLLRKCFDPFCFYQISPKMVLERSKVFLAN